MLSDSNSFQVEGNELMGKNTIMAMNKITYIYVSKDIFVNIKIRQYFQKNVFKSRFMLNVGIAQIVYNRNDTYYKKCQIINPQRTGGGGHNGPPNFKPSIFLKLPH